MVYFDMDMGHSKRPVRGICFSGEYGRLAKFIRIGIVAKFDIAKPKKQGDAMLLDEFSSVEIIPMLSDRKALKQIRR